LKQTTLLQKKRKGPQNGIEAVAKGQSVALKKEKSMVQDKVISVDLGKKKVGPIECEKKVGFI